MKDFQRVVILGSTGSIGENTLDVIARHPERLSVYALSAHTQIEKLAQQAQTFAAKIVVVPDDAARARFQAFWQGNTKPEVWVGPQALVDISSHEQCDTVMAAIVGIAGLPATLAAAQAGKRILLANKEALVAAGPLFMQAVRASGAELLPIDSEHNAIFQCLPYYGQWLATDKPCAGVRRLILTASGGPFRTHCLSDLRDITPAQACAHPNWTMGRKISIDSATMMNKGLEVIEAHWLFTMPAEQIEIIIHPQSVIHSMVEYEDGSTLAQLSHPDMRVPIAYGLGFPERIKSHVPSLDLSAWGRLDFEKPDTDRFPCLKAAFVALSIGQGACIALNAANEVAVEAFLAQQIEYLSIPKYIDATLQWYMGKNFGALSNLEEILALDQETRRYVSEQSTACSVI